MSMLRADKADLATITEENGFAAADIQNGWSEAAQWDEIFAPVGLDIQSQTVEEIAVSIAAQLILVRNSRKSEVLKQKPVD